MKKRIPLFLLILVSAVAVAGTVHDYFLLPESFFLHKGDKVNLHLLGGEQFVKQEEIGYQPAKTTSFMLYQGSKKIDLTKEAKDGAMPLVEYPLTGTGQALVEMTRSSEFNDVSRDNYADFLALLGYDKLSDKVKNGNQFRVKEKYTRYMKTLFSVEDHDGGMYDKDLKEEYEIILKDNPYRRKYGDDMTVQVKFKGKPAAAASVALYIKGISGNVYTQNLSADEKGEVTFTMSREGLYLVRSVRVEAAKDKDADYQAWWTSYTFPFSSSDEPLNTYKEFGFGNVH